ncbi:MAG: hypothetical protein RRY21_04240, partial [Oscillospiraceae bacterium]
MTRMEPKTLRCVAGNDRLMLMLMVLLEVLVGTTCIAFGLKAHRIGPLVLGAGIALAALALLMLRQTAPPKTELLSVDKDGFYFHPLTGAELEASYDWLRAAELSTHKHERVLRLIPTDSESGPSQAERQRTGKRKAAFAAPVLLKERTLESLCGQNVSLVQLAAALEDNRLLWALSGLADSERLTESMMLENDAVFYQAGVEAQLCSEGVCTRLRGREGVWLFPFSELSRAAAMASFEGGNREILVALIYKNGDLVALSDADPLFSPLYDWLS